MFFVRFLLEIHEYNTFLFYSKETRNYFKRINNFSHLSSKKEEKNEKSYPNYENVDEGREKINIKCIRSLC